MTKSNSNRHPVIDRAIDKLRLLPVFLICFLLGYCPLVGQSSAATLAGGPQPPGTVPAQPATTLAPGSAPSPLWHFFIWQALAIRGLTRTERATIVQAYRQDGWRPFFIDARLLPTARVQVLLQALSEMSDQGLDPRPYHLQQLYRQIEKLRNQEAKLRSSNPDFQTFLTHIDHSQSPTATVNPSSAPTQPAWLNATATDTSALSTRNQTRQAYRSTLEAASSVDTRLATCLVRYAREMSPFSTKEETQALLGKVSLSSFLRQLEPTSPHYAPLCRALAKYRRLALEKKFITLPELTLRPGDNGPAVRRLQLRLRQEGYYTGTVSGHYDKATRRAVQNFQRTHLLTADGVVGKHTLARLNVTYREQAKLIAISLKLLRHSHTRLFQRFVWVNIPQFELEYYRQNQLQSVHQVIVGRASGTKTKIDGRWMTVNQTPTMDSYIQKIVINPRWYVSNRIRLELNNDVAKDPNYFSENGYVKMSSTYPWGAPRLFQKPGPTNPLGRVKFEFPNRYAIFLHDTPSKQYFRRSQRDLSHGCIRMNKALNFAKELLEDDDNDAAQNMAAYLDSKRQIFIKLHHPVPIVVDYVPVSTNPAGQIVFCGDPYGWYKS